MKVLRLSPEYFCSPLWLETDDGVENIPTDAVDLPSPLREALERWAADYAETFQADDPGSSGFESPEAAADFERVGSALAAELSRVLGHSYRVLLRI